MDDTTPPGAIDLTRTFVRIVERRADGFVEFHFSIGDPELFVEMFLDAAAFEEFCTTQGAELLPAVQPHAAGHDGGEWGWTLHDATHQRFR